MGARRAQRCARFSVGALLTLGRAGSLRAAAAGIREICGPPQGRRLLHISDLHNRLTGIRFAGALVDALAPEVLVHTGDLSGAGGVFEAFLAAALGRVGIPHVFAPGNHDSPATVRRMAKIGALVLDAPGLVEAAGIPFWGYRDPNRTPMLGRKYSRRLCLEAAASAAPPEPVEAIAAVHNELMVRPGIFPTVLSGHMHTPRVGASEGTVWVRCGSTGGGRPWGWPLRAALVEVGGDSVRTERVWTLTLHRDRWHVAAAAPGGRPAIS